MVLEGITVGISSAHILYELALRTIDMDIQPLLAGDIQKIIPILLGLLIYTFFTKNYKAVYRAVMINFLLAGLGIGYARAWHGAIEMTIKWANIFTLDAFLIVVFVGTSFLYLIYTEKLHRFTQLPGKVGFLGLLAMYGWVLGRMHLGYQLKTIGTMLGIVTSSGIWVIPIAGLVILIDVFIGWNKILGRSGKANTET